jgi:transcriptional regulator with XRE-family HTH domain
MQVDGQKKILDFVAGDDYIATVTIRTSADTPLRGLRTRARKTIRQVASDLGIAIRTYIRWEQADALPDAVNLIRLGRYYRVPPAALVPAELVGDVAPARR